MTTDQPAQPGPAGGRRASRSATATPPSSRDLDLRGPDGQITVIVGANACGKSTLLRGLARLLRPRSGVGAARRRGDPPAAHQAGRPHARPAAAEPGRARGRHRRRPRRPRPAPAPGRLPALDERGRRRRSPRRSSSPTPSDLADRVVDELSGGQRQRVWIAMALAQGTDLLLLDEPTTYLDVAHQVEMLDLLADLNARRGTTIVMVLHDLNLSARYADHLVALHDGRIVAEGTPGRGGHRGGRPRPSSASTTASSSDPVSHTPLVVPVGARTPPADPPHQENRMTMTASPPLPMLFDRGRGGRGRAARRRPSSASSSAAPRSPTSASTARCWDQRIKLILPDPTTGGITSTEGADESWFAPGSSVPAAERGHMRTYTIRDVRGSGRGRPASSSTSCSTSRTARRRSRRPSGPRGRPGVTASCMLAPRRGMHLRRHRVRPRPARGPAARGRRDRRPGRLHAARAAARRRPRDGVPGGAGGRRRPGRSRVRPGVEVVWLAREGDALGVACYDAEVRRTSVPRWRAVRGRRRRRWTRTCGRPPVLLLLRRGRRRSGGHRRPRPRRAVRLDRGGVQGGHGAAPAPGQRSSASTAARSPSWATGGGVSR